MLNRLKDILKAEINSRIQENDGFKRLFEDRDIDIDEIIRNIQDSWNKNANADYDTNTNYRKHEDYGSQHSYKTNAPPLSKEAGYYKDLELAEGATFEQIKKQYRKLMKIYHPDLYHNDPEKHEIAQKISSKLNEAYVFFEKKFGKK